MLFCCLSSLFTLDLSSLSDTCFAKISSYPTGSFFTSLFPLRWHFFFTYDIILFDFICFCWLSFWFHIQEVIVTGNVIKVPSCLLFQEVCIYRFVYKIIYPFWVKICMQCYVTVQLHCLTCKHPLALDAEILPERIPVLWLHNWHTEFRRKIYLFHFLTISSSSMWPQCHICYLWIPAIFLLWLHYAQRCWLKKNSQAVKFYLGQYENCRPGDNSSDSFEKLFEEVRGKDSMYMILVKGRWGVQAIKHYFL